MKKTILAFACLSSLLLAGATAHAGGQSGAIGVGAEGIVGGGGALSVNFDGGPFHVGGALAFADPEGDDNTSVGFGGRFFYHLHSTAMSDFGLGGKLDVVLDDGPGDESDTNVFITLGFQTRAFVATNVALSAGAGLIIGAADAGGLALGGELTADFGVHYYFF